MGTPNQQQFLSLLGSHQKALLKVCWAYGRNSHDRDDLFQEIVARLWGAFGKYDPSRTFSTWMYRVALNVAIDYQRRRRRWGREGAGLDEMDVAAGDVDHTRMEQLRELRQMLERQGEADRAILLLYLEGHSYRQIAEVLGMTESNVGTRLSRVKKSMRESVQAIEQEVEQGACERTQGE